LEATTQHFNKLLKGRKQFPKDCSAGVMLEQRNQQKNMDWFVFRDSIS